MIASVSLTRERVFVVPAASQPLGFCSRFPTGEVERVWFYTLIAKFSLHADGTFAPALQFGGVRTGLQMPPVDANHVPIMPRNRHAVNPLVISC